jgi:hypothetical protein
MKNQFTMSGEEAQAIRDALSGRPNRRRSGGKKPGLAIMLVLILAGIVYVVTSPWAFFMGGHFHPLGYWAGWGRMHSKTAGDYLLYVEISPQPRPLEKIIPHTFLKGIAHLCTPKGERYFLKLNGTMPPHIFVNTVGQPVTLYLYNWRDVLLVGQESRPNFSLWGRWGQREVVADDRQTLSKAFLPNGILRPPGAHIEPAELEDIQLKLHEGTYAQWEAACTAAQH